MSESNKQLGKPNFKQQHDEATQDHQLALVFSKGWSFIINILVINILFPNSQIFPEDIAQSIPEASNTLDKVWRR